MFRFPAMRATRSAPADGETGKAPHNRNAARSRARIVCAALALGSGVMFTVPAFAHGTPDSFAGLAKRVSPAVVNIQTAGGGSNPSGAPGLPPGLGEDTPFGEFFKRFFGEQFQFPQGQQGQRSRPRVQGAGSGFIIDARGHIVTNNHVIQGADEITVTLQDGTQESATLIGRDPKTDIAVLKINARRSLPFLRFGDSDKLEVGDWVVAVGNPFGLGGTVTAGIVSARGRNIGSGPYDDFIQTDASINRGNSGGPLFDVAGNVVGINTAIFSPSGGNVGIGFAIPAKLAKPIIDQLRDTGTIERGWLGVQIQTVTPELAESLGLDKPRGALVAEVNPSSPAAQSGLQTGDVILRFNGQAVTEMRELPRIVAETQANSRVPVQVLRRNRTQNITVQVGRMPDGPQVASTQRRSQPGGSQTETVAGLELSAITPQLRQRFGLDSGIIGVLVLDHETTDADRRLQPGDVIVSINQRDMRSPRDVSEAARAARRDGRRSMLALVQRDGNARFVALPIS